MEKTVKKGSKVKVDYTGSTEGVVFDTSEGKQPLEFEVGKGMIIPGFEEGMMDMKIGEEKTVKIFPDKAYGTRNDKLVQEVPLEQLKLEEEPKPGMVLTLKDPSGKMHNAMVTKVGDGKMTLDLNHPLAGKTLEFKIKIVDIS